MSAQAPLPPANDNGCATACGCGCGAMALLGVFAAVNSLAEYLGPDFWVALGLTGVVAGVLGWWGYLATRDTRRRVRRQPEPVPPLPVPPPRSAAPDPDDPPAFPRPSSPLPAPAGSPAFPSPWSAPGFERVRCESCGRVVDPARHRPVVCPRCGAVYHTACWNRLDGCVSEACGDPGPAPSHDPEPSISLEASEPEVRGDPTCPYCRYPITTREARVDCPACDTPHHRECWQANGGCTTYGCRGHA